MPLTSLKLGSLDAGSPLSSHVLKSYIKSFGFSGAGVNHPINKYLRDDDRTLDKRWPTRAPKKDKKGKLTGYKKGVAFKSWKRNKSDEVVKLTKFLEKAGFMPHASHDGFFGYVTQAAVRLFQEYVRTRDPDYNSKNGISYPDGIVGPTTWANITRWEKQWEKAAKNKKKEKAKKADWASPPTGEEAEIAKTWRASFKKTAKHLRKNPGPMEAANKRFKGKTDSLLPEDWKFPKGQPLLFGIRRMADIDNHVDRTTNEKKWDKRRPLDDLFVLLINGHSFLFYGSTDPSVHQAKKIDEAFLINGQHLYQFSWHSLSSPYRAFRPAKYGVMVIRDSLEKKGIDALTKEDIDAGPDHDANTTINIHWSGRGHNNYSAGCQVIAGSGYLNGLEEFQNCTDFAATHSANLGKKTNPRGGELTKGAYNVLMDLILVYGRNSRWSPTLPLRYTLFSADDMVAAGAISHQKITGLRTKLN